MLFELGNCCLCWMTLSLHRAPIDGLFLRYHGLQCLQVGDILCQQNKNILRDPDKCVVCNHLRPDGHEATFGKPEPPGAPRPWANKEDLCRTPTLVRKVHAGYLLVSHSSADQSALRNYAHKAAPCAYCRFICECLDRFALEWPRRGAHEQMIELMIKQDCPLVVRLSDAASRIDLEIYFEPGVTLPSGAPTIGAALPRSTDSWRQTEKDFLLDCLEQCCATHERCRQDASLKSPTRLVYVGGSDHELRVCEDVRPVPYAALSYSWGNSKKYVLTPENPALLSALKFGELPSVFRDAITVARSLRMNWIWIDALCIFQDGLNKKAWNDDWNFEITQMGDYYKNAFIVIAASSSWNSDDPILAQRPQEWLPTTVHFRLSTGNILPLKVRRRHLPAAPLEQGLHEPPFTDAWSKLQWDGSVYTRAWCFQEVLLAHRVVHFVPGSIVFQCKSHRRGEDQMAPYPQMFSNVLGQLDKASQWRKVVQAYSSRDITVVSDKIPAIAGIAEYSAQGSTGVPYLAGLWQDNSLLGDLLWQVSRPLRSQLLDHSTYKSLPYSKATEVLAKDGTLRTIKECVTPSWSWASLNEPVMFLELGNFSPLATVKGVSFEPTQGKDRYANVKSGMRIHLQTRTLDCRLKYIESNGRLLPDKQLRAIILETEGLLNAGQLLQIDGPLAAWHSETMAQPIAHNRSFVMRARNGPVPDPVLQDWGDGRHALIAFVADTGWNLHRRMGLLLVPSTKHDNAWERVGIIGTMSGKQFQKAKPRTINLV